VWKTTVKKLKKAGVSSREIMAISGHKNERSLADYNNLDLDDQLHLGEILSRSSNSSDAATPTVTHCSSSSTSHIPISSNCSFPSVPMVFHNCHETFGSATFSSYSQSQSSHSLSVIHITSPEKEAFYHLLRLWLWLICSDFIFCLIPLCALAIYINMCN